MPITDYTKTRMDQLLAGRLAVSQRGVAGGVAPLDADGKVPVGNLPAAAGGTTFGSASRPVPFTTDTAATVARPLLPVGDVCWFRGPNVRPASALENDVVLIVGVGPSVVVGDGLFALFGPEAGGFLTGLSVADDGTMYTRADVGGAYRKAPGFASPWTQLFTTASVPAPRHEDFLCDALACDPTQPQHVYAAVGSNFTDGRVLRSTDSGTTWTDPGPKRFQVHGNAEWRYGREPLAVQHDQPLVVYYGTRREGLWRSTDGAVTWTQLTALPAPPSSTDYNRLDVTFVLIVRTSASVGGVRQGLWAGVRGRGIYRSPDGGTTWALVHASPSSTAWPRDAMFDSNGALLVCWFDPNASSTPLVRITAAGAVSVITPPGSSKLSTVAVHPTNPGLILVGHDGIGDGRFWRSTDGGGNWTTLNVAINNGADGAVWPTQSDLDGYMSTGQIRFDPADPSRLWFAEGMGAWWSNDLADAETMWTFASKGIQELVANAIVKPPGTGAVAVTWDRGVWKWNAAGKAMLPYTGIFCSAWDVQTRPDSPLVLAATVSDHQTGDTNAAKRLSAVSLDGGDTWARLGSLTDGTAPSGLRFGTIAIARGDTNNLVWAPSFEDNGFDLPAGVPMRYSTDRGGSWLTPTVTPAMGAGERLSGYKHLKQRRLIADPTVNAKFWAISDNPATGDTFLLVSTDRGANWTRAQVFSPGGYDARFGCHITAVAVGGATRLFFSPGPRGDRLEAMGAAGQLPTRTSSDGGATWTNLPTMLGAHAIGVGAAITPSTNPTLFTYGWVGGVKGLYRSTDLGQTWTLIVDTPLGWHQGISAICGDPEAPGKVYVGMPGGSFFVGGTA